MSGTNFAETTLIFVDLLHRSSSAICWRRVDSTSSSRSAIKPRGISSYFYQEIYQRVLNIIIILLSKIIELHLVSFPFLGVALGLRLAREEDLVGEDRPFWVVDRHHRGVDTGTQRQRRAGREATSSFFFFFLFLTSRQFAVGFFLQLHTQVFLLVDSSGCRRRAMTCFGAGSRLMVTLVPSLPTRSSKKSASVTGVSLTRN